MKAKIKVLFQYPWFLFELFAEGGQQWVVCVWVYKYIYMGVYVCVCVYVCVWSGWQTENNQHNEVCILFSLVTSECLVTVFKCLQTLRTTWSGSCHACRPLRDYELWCALCEEGPASVLNIAVVAAATSSGCSLFHLHHVISS